MKAAFLLLYFCAGVCWSKSWIWQGALTSTSLSFKVKTDEAEFRLVAISHPGNLTLARYVKDSMFSFPSEGTRSLHLVLSNLEPNTSYTWSATGDLSGAFRTPPPEGTRFNFTFAFASCADNDSSHELFALIPQHLDPLFFVHMGDLHYGNLETGSVLDFADMYDRTLHTTQSTLFTHLPVVYMFDDHDYGQNNADKFSPSRPAALEAYRRFVPHYDLLPDVDDDLPPLYQSFVMGTILFVVTDTSSQRVPLVTTLGAVQKKWLVEQFHRVAKKEFDALVWVCTLPWIDDHYKWGEFKDERSEIAAVISLLNIQDRVIMISGDAHMVAVDDGRNAEGSFKVFHAAALDAKPTTKGGPYSHGVFPGRNQYGTMHVYFVDSRVCFEFQGWRMIASRQLKRLIRYDSCFPPPYRAKSEFVPSPLFVQESWKRLKKVMEPHSVLVPLVVYVDSSTLTFYTVVDNLNLLVLALALWVLLARVWLRRA